MFDESDVLMTISQLAIGVAGFSGIAIVFKRQPGKLVDVEVYRIAILFANAIAAMFVALLPFPLHYIFDTPATVWRVCSGVMALYGLFFTEYLLRNTRRFYRRIPQMFNMYHMYFTSIGHIVNVALQTGNMFGLFRNQQSAIFIFGALWLLFHSTFQFGRILFVQPPSWALEPPPETESAAAPK